MERHKFIFLRLSISEEKMVSSSSIQDSDNAPANQNPIIVTNETHNQVYIRQFIT